MNQTYHISGMTCSGCEAKVKQSLSTVNGVENVAIDLATGEANIKMTSPLPLSAFESVLPQRYTITSKELPPAEFIEEEKRSFLETYKPVLLVFGYLLGISLLVEYLNGEFQWMRWMRHFMAGFFLVFSFFKILNLKDFTNSYAMYDIIAKKWKGWGFAYAFVELGLGIAFLTSFNPVLTNLLTFVVMTISLVGVLQSVLNKRKIRCACLGAVFNLPVSTITIIEDALMIAMSAIMLSFMI